jgi:hypothetical protein
VLFGTIGHKVTFIHIEVQAFLPLFSGTICGTLGTDDEFI